MFELDTPDAFGAVLQIRPEAFIANTQKLLCLVSFGCWPLAKFTISKRLPREIRINLWIYQIPEVS
jgi:hypothetical protein